MLPIRLRHGPKAAELLGYPSSEALRKARERGNLPEGSFYKEGRYWYYIVPKLVEVPDEKGKTEEAEARRWGDTPPPRADLRRAEGAVPGSLQVPPYQARSDVQRTSSGWDQAQPGRDLPDQAQGRRQVGPIGVAEREEARARAAELFDLR